MARALATSEVGSELSMGRILRIPDGAKPLATGWWWWWCAPKAPVGMGSLMPVGKPVGRMPEGMRSVGKPLGRPVGRPLGRSVNSPVGIDTGRPVSVGISALGMMPEMRMLVCLYITTMDLRRTYYQHRCHRDRRDHL